MTSIEFLTSFFGWFTIVNIGIYIIVALSVLTMRDFMVRTNTRMFGLTEEDVKRATFTYVGNYKLAITVLAFAPWLALKLMA